MTDYDTVYADTDEYESPDSEIEGQAIGDPTEDGSIYAGLSPDTGDALFVAPETAPNILTWPQAVRFADNCKLGGHEDWRLPTIKELEMLSDKREVGTLSAVFSEYAGPNHAYWSKTIVKPFLASAMAHNFEHRTSSMDRKYLRLPVCAVRTASKPQL